MQKFFRCIVMAALFAGTASPALAGELQLTIANGRVTLVATDVPIREILSEWARVGQTQIVNGEKVVGPNVSLQLVDVPETEALDIVLRSAAGYMVAPRQTDTPGNSAFGRIMILATSRPPASTGVAQQAPAPFNTRPPMPQPMPVDDDNGEPQDQGVVPPPGMQPPNVQTQPGMPVQQPMVQPYPGGNFPQQQQQPQQPTTMTRPGMPPAPPQQPGVPNPYIPGRPPVTRPGGGGGQ